MNNSDPTGTVTEVAVAYVEAINAHDLDLLSSLMAPEFCFIDAHGQVVQGSNSMRAGWARYFALFPDYHLAIGLTISDSPQAVLIGEASASFHGLKDRAWRIPIAIRACTRDRMITEWHVFADTKLPLDSMG